MGTFTHTAERKAFELALNKAMRKAADHRCEDFVGLVDMIEKVLGDGWDPSAYENLREAFGKDGKWTGYLNHLIENNDVDYLKGLMMSLVYEGALRGYR